LTQLRLSNPIPTLHGTLLVNREERGFGNVKSVSIRTLRTGFDKPHEFDNLERFQKRKCEAMWNRSTESHPQSGEPSAHLARPCPVLLPEA
ncbi:MAG TPA: hypothetical protein VKB86_06035, partial [Pyrinomonadaceae bacterium]|nr:hypothetical protein [Pyrinomonadaceae bacterium]